MATQEQLDNILYEITMIFQKINSYSIDELTQEESFGKELSFKEIENYFINISDLIDRVKKINLKNIPFTFLLKFKNPLQKITAIYERAIIFSPRKISDPSIIRQQIINDLNNEYDNFQTHSLPILTFGLLNNNDLSIERSKINQLITELEKEKTNSKKESEAKLKELNDIIENARSFATKAGVSKHSSLFKEEAIFHEDEAKKWLNYTVGILVSIALLAFILTVLGLHYFKENNEIIQFSITKIIIITVLFYGLALTNRNYKAHKHNAIMNKHRQNALSTFETFSGAASADDNTKNAVLLETTHSIFSNQQTGYLKADGDSESNNKIIEIIKNVSIKGE